MSKETYVWNALFEAVDMLDNRQFEFYLMAKGVIPEGSSLRETIKLGDEKALKMIGVYSPKRDLSKLDDARYFTQTRDSLAGSMLLSSRPNEPCSLALLDSQTILRAP